MAVTSNQFSSKPFNINKSREPADHAFTLTKSDTNYIEHPSTSGFALCTRAITVDINTEAVKVEFANGLTHTFPAGSLAAGVPISMHVVKLFSTGTGASVVVTGLF
jgi:hypothetical protein